MNRFAFPSIVWLGVSFCIVSTLASLTLNSQTIGLRSTDLPRPQSLRDTTSFAYRIEVPPAMVGKTAVLLLRRHLPVILENEQRTYELETVCLVRQQITEDQHAVFATIDVQPHQKNELLAQNQHGTVTMSIARSENSLPMKREYSIEGNLTTTSAVDFMNGIHHEYPILDLKNRLDKDELDYDIALQITD